MVADRISQGSAQSSRVGPRVCGPVRSMRLAGAWHAMAVSLLVGGCDENRLQGPAPDSVPPVQAIVSNPVASPRSTVISSTSTLAVPADADVAYVSLPPGAIPDGEIVVIRSRTTGSTVTAALADGGFDPVPVLASPGDTLDLEIQLGGGASSVQIAMVIPLTRRPGIVRTFPPPKKRDVVLNTPIVIVFSEPIRSSSAGSIRLIGGSEVSGVVTVTADGLRAQFTPSGLLAPNTTYVLSVPTDVMDLSGDALEQPEMVEFSTGSAVALASVATDPTALFTRPAGSGTGGDLRTLHMRATLLDDGSFTGTFNILYPGTGGRTFGRVACFSIEDGTAAWVAGIVEEPPYVGVVAGWRVTDNGPPEAGVPDELSLAWVDTGGVLGSAEDWCANRPLTWPGGQEIHMFAVESGDVVVNPAGPPPPPPSGGMSEIAFVAPGAGIQIINADGSGGRAVTSLLGDFTPSWSPDGSRIAFTSYRDSAARGDIYLVNRDGSGLTRLTSDPSNDVDPAWSPDGTGIAFFRDGSIHVMNASDGSNVTPLTTGGGDLQPAWSPDGSQIAFARRGDIYVMNADGAGLRPLTGDSAIDDQPAWSPDGMKIAFRRAPPQGGGGAIHVMNSDGSGIARLTLAGQAPTWSPDGTMILYEDFGLTIMRADGSGRKRLGPGFTPAWSPVGTMPPPLQPNVSIQMTGGDGQSDTVFATLAQPLSVRLLRDDGTPVAGARVDWYMTGAGQSASQPKLSTYITRTDSSGVASVRMTLGSRLGPVTARAVVTDGSAHTSGVAFTANATAGAPVSLCCNQDYLSLVEARSSLGYSVTVRDGHGNSVPGIPITWAVTAGGGSITPTHDTTAYASSSGQTESGAVHTLGMDEGVARVTATAPTMAGSPQMTFSHTVVTAIVWVYDGYFSSGSVTIPSGKTVTWIWDYGSNSYSHNVTFEDDPTEPTSSPTLDGGSFSRTFGGGPRTIRYRCTAHSTGFDDPQGEIGEIIVQ